MKSIFSLLRIIGDWRYPIWNMLFSSTHNALLHNVQDHTIGKRYKEKENDDPLP